MKKIILNNPSKGLYNKFLLRLIEVDNSIRSNSKRISIPYPVLYEKFCRNYSSNKSEIRETLLFLAEFGFIKVNQKGIILNFEIKDDRK
jgi:hypothetical protein